MRELLKLKSYLRAYLPLLITSGLLAIPLAALRFSPVPVAKTLMDEVLVERDESKLMYVPAAFIALALGNFIVRFFHFYLLRIVTSRVNQRIKNDLYDHLMGLSADYFTENSTGTLISRVGHDVVYIDRGIECINMLIREPLTFIFLFGYTLYLDWQLTLIVLVTFPFLAWVFDATGRNLKRYIVRIQGENAKLYSTIQESFTGIRVIKAFRLEKYLRKRFRGQNETLTRMQLKTSALEEASHPMVELLMYSALAGVVYYGGSRILVNQMTIGEFTAFIAAFALMISPIRMMNDVNIKLNQASAAASRINEMFAWRANIHEPEAPQPVQGFRNEIRLENVRFAYPDAPEREVLKGIDLTIPKGRVVALVGQSGAGKSSLITLLPRIFDVTGGRILLDGRDIRELKLDDLRKLIAVVSQEVFLFNDTIEENIRCGRFSATAEEIREAARKAHVEDFIRRLPDGYATVIGDRGQKLSGGERQRLSIARAFLREAPILILDEATSNLDTESERTVQVALEELMKDRTTLIIAHRLSTIRNADQIIVMKEGRIVETGRHDDLLVKDGEYARFHSLSTTSVPEQA